jgi:hypothetical protein
VSAREDAERKQPKALPELILHRVLEGLKPGRRQSRFQGVHPEGAECGSQQQKQRGSKEYAAGVHASIIR